MRWSLLMLCLMTGLPAVLPAQKKKVIPPSPHLIVLEDSMVRVADAMFDAETPTERMQAGRQLRRLMGEALSLPGSWTYPFDRIAQVSVQRAPEGEFRLFSWQVPVDTHQFQHYAYLQRMASPDQPVLLNSRGGGVESDRAVLGPDSWIGQVYYRIYPFRHKGRSYWLLFGFSSHKGRTHRKILDILHFDAEDKPVFGAPLLVFEDTKQKTREARHRLILEYAGESQVRLNYDEHFKLVLFDHLIPFAGDRDGGGLRQVPDGSYCGFKLQKGEWIYMDKVFDQVMDEAPVHFPVLDSRKDKDIFGRPRG